MTDAYPLPPPFSDDEVLQPLRSRSDAEPASDRSWPFWAAGVGATVLAVGMAIGGWTLLGHGSASRDRVAALIEATALPAAPAETAADKPTATPRAAPTAERNATPAAPAAPPPVPTALTTAELPAPASAAAVPPARVAPPASAAPVAREQAPKPLASPRVEPARRLGSEEVRTHLERGEALLAQGDLSAARLFFERVAEAGDARGAAGLARSYDPAALSHLPIHGVAGDPAQAERWRRIAGSMAPAYAERR